MISKQELGRRLRDSRVEKGLTLKQLDQASGFSATHISEIERGKTSPTIGALIRIASALGKEPSFFIEEHLLKETSLIGRDQRESSSFPGGGRVETLSPGIPGGRLYASMLHLDPGHASIELAGTEGEEGGLVVSGRVEFRVGDESHELSAGDAIHHDMEQARSIRALGDGPAAVLLVATHRLEPRG